MTEPIILLTCSLLIIAWIFIFILSMKMNISIAPIIVGASLVHTLFLVVLPVVHAVWSEFMFEDMMEVSVGSQDILRVMKGELIFVAMFIVGFGFLPLVKKYNPSCKKKNAASNFAELAALKLLLSVGFLIYLVNVVASSISEYPLITHLMTIFWYSPLVVAVFILVGPQAKDINLFWIVCALFITLFVAYITFQTGVRGRIFWIFSLVVFASFFYKKYEYLIITFPILVILLPIFALLGTAEIRFNVLPDSTSPVQLASSIYKIANSTSLSLIETLNVTLESFAFRAQGVRNSVVLYNDFDAGGGGLNIYLGVPTVFIPTYLLPDKPLLGSLSSSTDDFAMYKVIQIGYGRGGEMGPFLASAHAYWEGGWFWVVFCGLITGMFWKYVLIFSSRLPDIIGATIVFSFGASFLIDGFMTMLSPLYTFMYMFLRSVMPILLIYFFFDAFAKVRIVKKKVL